MSSPDVVPGRFTWQRVWRHEDAVIQPLNAGTVYRATEARLWIHGKIVANLDRRSGRWVLTPLDQTAAPTRPGSTALEAVSNWLLSSEENLT